MSMFVAKRSFSTLDVNAFTALLSGGVIEMSTEVPVSVSRTAASATDQRPVRTPVLVALSLAALRQLRHLPKEEGKPNNRTHAICTFVQ